MHSIEVRKPEVEGLGILAVAVDKFSLRAESGEMLGRDRQLE